MATQSAKASEIERKWYVVDAAGQPLGRLASKVAHVLRGKHRPEFTPHVDTGDFVVVVNAEKVAMSGKKWDQKEYRWYTGYTGQKSITASDRREKAPELIISEAVRRMLPKNKLGVHMLKKLKVFVGPDHPHQAQQPETLEVAAK